MVLGLEDMEHLRLGLCGAVFANAREAPSVIDGAPPPPPEIEPLKKELIKSPSLRSGKIYFPLDALYYFKSLRPLALALLPKDSHGWMNLDSPEQGFKFEYAMQAAIKRTRIEYEQTLSGLPRELLSMFVNG